MPSDRHTISEKSHEDGSDYGSEEDKAGIKANPQSKDPFSLEPVDPKLAKKEKKLKAKEEDIEEELKDKEKQLKKKEVKVLDDKKMKRIESLQTVVRFMGCFIFVIDICCKIQYYLTVRFVSLQLKQVYKSFLFVRPIAILCIILYNFIIGSI